MKICKVRLIVIVYTTCLS